jgi:DNA-binding transcriptional ArsR family regulator
MTGKPVDAGFTGKPVDAVFTALSDPTRRSVMRLLSEGDANATEIADQLPISRQAVAKHLSTLSEAGLVTSQRDGRENRYHLTPQPFHEVMSWMADVGAGWDSRLGALRTFLQR